MKKAIHIVLALCVVFVLIPGTFQGQESTAEAETAIEGPNDPAELEAFVDGMMKAHMEANHIAGATFSYVKEGEIFFAKGYGYSDVEKKKPVKANETMFRPGSVSKLFTWTAVMQLYEQGRRPQQIPAYGSDEVADVTGAGDTVIAVFTLAVIAGAGFADAARLSNYAAGLVVLKMGTATVSPDELIGAIQEVAAEEPADRRR